MTFPLYTTQRICPALSDRKEFGKCLRADFRLNNAVTFQPPQAWSSRSVCPQGVTDAANNMRVLACQKPGSLCHVPSALKSSLPSSSQPQINSTDILSVLAPEPSPELWRESRKLVAETPAASTFVPLVFPTSLCCLLPPSQVRKLRLQGVRGCLEVTQLVRVWDTPEPCPHLQLESTFRAWEVSLGSGKGTQRALSTVPVGPAVGSNGPGVVRRGPSGTPHHQPEDRSLDGSLWTWCWKASSSRRTFKEGLALCPRHTRYVGGCV